MATVWTRAYYQPKRTFLLMNGDTLDASTVEETPSGRRVRIEKYPDLVGYSRDLDDILVKAAEREAQRLGTQIWMSTENTYGRHHKSDVTGGVEQHLQEVTLHLLSENQNMRGHSSELWWTFQHPKMPLYAHIRVQIQTLYYANSRGVNPIRVNTWICYTDTRPKSGVGYSASTLNETDLKWNNARAYTNVVDSFWDAAPQDLPTPLRDFDTLVPALEHILSVVRRYDALDTVQIPDLRGTPEWMDLEFAESNVNDAFIQKLIDFHEALPSLEEAADHYRELVKALRLAGIVVDNKSAESLAVQIANNDGATIDIQPMQDGDRDHNHLIRINLATGMAAVMCSNEHDREAYDDWREAVTVASLTGQQDELLEYAKARVISKRSKKFDADVELARASL